jgi:hypothetical protein
MKQSVVEPVEVAILLGSCHLGRERGGFMSFACMKMRVRKKEPTKSQTLSDTIDSLRVEISRKPDEHRGFLIESVFKS